MLENLLEILMVVVLAAIATYDTLQSRRKEPEEGQQENQVFDIAS